MLTVWKDRTALYRRWRYRVMVDGHAIKGTAPTKARAYAKAERDVECARRILTSGKGE